ncbi:hypothetical protein EON65_06060 [archaeon]|nr:MAG: hypothetical protein EON65_06060 [archaeon]
MVHPLLLFAQHEGNFSVSCLSSNPPFLSATECSLHWLHHWTTRKAMLSKINKQGDNHRDWRIASLMNSFLLIREEPTAETDSCRACAQLAS